MSAEDVLTVGGLGAQPIAITKTKAALKEIAAALKALDDKRRYRAIDFFIPYPKQQEFFDASSDHDERLLSAGNQQGKTQAGAAEMTYHLTGDYPDDWLGRKWDRPVYAWACGESALLVRDVQQAKLCGEPGLDEAFGTGLIPKASFIGKPSLARGIIDAYDTIHVRHKSGGVSTLKFKSYEQGRAKFQGKPVDIVWCDEEPAMDIYTECLARIAATDGSIYTTFTPLKGITELWQRFLDANAKNRYRVVMAVKDALHFDTPEKIAKLLERYPAHEHATRLSGAPMMGEGRVFLTPDQNISEPTLTYVPPHWTKLWSIDFGIGHPFACTLQAWDRDTRCHPRPRRVAHRGSDPGAARRPHEAGGHHGPCRLAPGRHSAREVGRDGEQALQEPGPQDAGGSRHVRGRRLRHRGWRAGDGRAYEDRAPACRRPPR